MTERVGFSLGRVCVIAGNTFTESVRQKVYNLLLIFALVAIASASFFAQFTFGEQMKFVKDICLGALSVIGSLIAIVGTAQLIPSETENRTIYTILAKPVRRFEFLLGKYMGSLLMIVVSLLLMSVMVGAVLLFKEQRLVADALHEAAGAADTTEVRQIVGQIRAEAFDPGIIKGIVLIFVKLALLSAVTMLVSTFSTSMVFNVACGLMMWIVGNLVGVAKEAWADSRLAMIFLAIVPDLSFFNVDDIISGAVVPMSFLATATFYGLWRIAVLVAAAHVIFSRREI